MPYLRIATPFRMIPTLANCKLSTIAVPHSSILPKSQLRSSCPIACTLDVLGDSWTLLVIRDLFEGKRYFDEFLSSPEGIATNILTSRLARLGKLKLVDRFKLKDDRRRVAYELTDVGRSLKPMLKVVARWGVDHFPGTSPATGLPSRPGIVGMKRKPRARAAG